MVGLNSIHLWFKTKISNMFVKAILNSDIVITSGGSLFTQPDDKGID